MNEQEAKRLLPQAVVMWDNDPDDAGTVREVGYSGFAVDWANGQRGWIDFKDAERVSLWDSCDVGV
jgi:hypothetical protein